jgi:hypothetical protein
MPNILLTRALFFAKKSLYFQYINSVVSPFSLESEAGTKSKK